MMKTDEAFLDKLEQVLSRLTRQKSLRLDDTCLHKLLDNIRILCKDGSLSDTSVFKDFLDDIDVTQEAVDESVKIFAVRLFGIIGEDEVAFKHSESSGLVTRFFGRLNQKLLCQDLSVLSSVFICLRGVLSHGSGLTWFLHSASDFLHSAFDVLRTGKSLFVVSSAQEFIIELWVRTKKLVLSAGADSEPNRILKQIHEELWTMVEGPVKDSTRTVSPWGNTVEPPDQGCLSALEIVRQFCGKTEPGLYLEREKVDVLMNCLFHKPSSAFVIIDIVQQRYCKSEGPAAADLEKTIISTINRLLDLRQVDTVLTMAQTFCFRFPLDNREWLQELSLLPIHCVLCTEPPTSLHGQLVLSHMKGRKAFTQALSSAISCAAQLEDKAMSATLCDIVKVLHYTSDKCVTTMDILGTKHLHQNPVLQRVALETIRVCIDRRRASTMLDLNLVTHISKCLLQITEDSQTPVQILMVLFRTWNSVLNLYCRLRSDVKAHHDTNEHFANHASSTDNSCYHSYDSSNDIMKGVLDSLSFCVEKKMCDLQWEVRDTAVEFLTGLINLEDGRDIEQWILSHRLHISLWQCVRDQESYVRASALKSVGCLVQSHSLWHSLQQHIATTDLLMRVVEIVRTDSEAFPRRAGVDLLSVLFCCVSLVHQNVILSTLQDAVTKDFDWDVQLKALTFWEGFVEWEIKSMLDNSRANSHLPDYAAGLGAVDCNLKRKSPEDTGVVPLLEKLHTSGVLTVLLSALQDCDRSVSEKACRILIPMKQKLNAHLSEGVTESTKKSKSDENISGVTDSKLCNGASAYVSAPSVETFISVLNDRDLHEKLTTISQSSDEYVRNPKSLLEDILNSLIEDQNEDNIIDCY